MKNFIESIRKSIQEKNWYGALTLTLTLPDICGRIEYPNTFSSKRYSNWFNKYVKPKYTRKIGAAHELHIFLSGKDCYALRCAYLHEGITSIFSQRNRDILDDFQFIVPPQGTVIHCNQMNNKLQLQVENFCNEIVNSVETWLDDIKDDQVKISKINNLLNISIFTPGAPIIL